jgi:hypothetical protein
MAQGGRAAKGAHVRLASESGLQALQSDISKANLIRLPKLLPAASWIVSLGVV